jgi:hypothetical protein
MEFVLSNDHQNLILSFELGPSRWPRVFAQPINDTFGSLALDRIVPMEVETYWMPRRISMESETYWTPWRRVSRHEALIDASLDDLPELIDTSLDDLPELIDPPEDILLRDVVMSGTDVPARRSVNS